MKRKIGAEAYLSRNRKKAFPQSELIGEDEHLVDLEESKDARISSLKGNYSCETCQLSFRTKKKLINHRRTPTHKLNESRINEPEPPGKLGFSMDENYYVNIK